MKKLQEPSLTRLAGIQNGAGLAHPTGIASMIRSGLVRPSLTAAGIFALTTGFEPSARELQLLQALVGGDVWPELGWRTDSYGDICAAPGTVLGRFAEIGLATSGRYRSHTVAYRATPAGAELGTRIGAYDRTADHPQSGPG